MGWQNPRGSSLDGVLTGWKSLLEGEGAKRDFEETLHGIWLAAKATSSAEVYPL